MQLAPPGFAPRPFVGNVLGAVRGTLRASKSGAAVWVRAGQTFEGEYVRFEFAQGGRIVSDEARYLYHCAY